jgi:hypothetical protein
MEHSRQTTISRWSALIEPLGTDYAVACGEDGGRAAALNALFDEWRAKRDGEPIEGIA